MSEERLSFQAEVSRLLDIVAHSLYSDKEVFLRELISNASDACDRLRYAALTTPDLLGDDAAFAISLVGNQEQRTLEVIDNGVGMSRQDLIDNLGTIARSGTVEFVNKLSGDSRKDVNLIGQFGVGFYSAFMVAGEVEVFTRKAGETHGWHWRSDGRGDFTIESVDDERVPPRGARVVLHLRDDAGDYLEEFRLRTVVRKYSDHIAIPIRFGTGAEAKVLNTASALWMRPRNEITEEQYREFYHHVSHSFDEPWLTLHWRAEGKIEYTSLLFLPRQRPMDLFDPKRVGRVKLYVKRVFITDQVEELLPPYLRFVRGIVDSEDLPLNISREMLQNNPVLARIKSGLTRRLLTDIARKADDTEADAVTSYLEFWGDFGVVLKEGLYEDSEHREQLFRIARFRSTRENENGWTSLAGYLERMKEGQAAIYFLSGEDLDTVRRSPQLEGFKARGVEVLLLTDPVDEFWIQAVHDFQGKPFKSVTRGGTDLSALPLTESESQPPAPASEGGLGALIARFKTALGEEIKDVRASERLTDSAVCLVADDSDIDLHLERLLRQHRQLGFGGAKRILEINPRHPLILGLAARAEAGEGDGTAGESMTDLLWLLYDQARIVEGEPLQDAMAFSHRLARVLGQGLG